MVKQKFAADSSLQLQLQLPLLLPQSPRRLHSWWLIEDREEVEARGRWTALGSADMLVMATPAECIMRGVSIGIEHHRQVDDNMSSFPPLFMVLVLFCPRIPTKSKCTFLKYQCPCATTMTDDNDHEGRCLQYLLTEKAATLNAIDNAFVIQKREIKHYNDDDCQVVVTLGVHRQPRFHGVGAADENNS